LIKTNNLADLQFFLELGADVEVGLPAFEITGLHCDVEPTALLVAADLDNVPLARLLLEKGAKVQHVGKFSPMHAVRSAEMVQLLLDHNTDPNFDHHLGDRPLHWHARWGNIAAMRALLQYGAEVNAIGYLGTPLHGAAQHNLAAVELLVEHGADVKRCRYPCNTALHLAADAGKTDVVKFLVERWPEGIRGKNRFGDTPLHLAAEKAQTEVVRHLVERWPEGKEALNNDGKTPL
jgi:ankyrin repeat protein